MNAQRSGALFLTLATVFMMVVGVSAQDTASDSSGRIAYIGADSNVYTTDLSGSEPTQLTSDAGIINDDKYRFYVFPTWSTDGRLAYFASELERSGASRTEVWISPDGVQTGASAYTFENDGFTYAYWSPQNCAVDETCRDLAVLLTRQDAGGFVVELVRDLAGEDQHILTGNGTPFYFSWSPEGGRMFWHRNDDSLDVYNIESDAVDRSVRETPALFGAPAWSPVDERLLFASSSEDETSLIINTDDADLSLVSGLQGPVAFSWSPDGSRVAYTDQQGALMVLDAATGEEVTRSTTGGVLSFFWSPDSQKIAFITLVQSSSGSFSAMDDSGAHLASMVQGTPGIAWSVMDAATGATTQYSSFIPTQPLVYMLGYFDQFSQSHQVWSPDSRYLVYSEVTEGDRAVVSVLDTSQIVSVPFVVADGTIAIWSYR